MTLPHWLGIPGVILMIGLIAYGVRQGSKVTSRQDSTPEPPLGAGSS
ncbi:hypothetical protein ACQR1Y_31825 [Bradyrhizobium sp. HKCCYLRH3099]